MHGPLYRYVILRVAHAPGMPGTIFPPPWVSDPDMHHGTCVTHVLWCMPGLLNSDFLWKRSRHSRRMGNPQFYVSGKRLLRSTVLVRASCRRWYEGLNENKSNATIQSIFVSPSARLLDIHIYWGMDKIQHMPFSHAIPLTNWGWYKMAVIFQTSFWNAFSWMKMYGFV